MSAASLLESARSRAGITQEELGERASVSQSVISMYERGRRNPSLPTLERLIRAAGFELKISLATSSRLSDLVQERRDELVAALKSHGASNIRLFGSVARGDDGPDSDVDLLVDIGPKVGLFALGRMETAAADILGVPVDVVPSDSLKPAFEHVLSEAVPL